MGRIRTVKLTSEQRQELATGYNYGESPVFRKRCHIILLKSNGRTSSDVSSIVQLNVVSINNWLTRYEDEGINGLKNKPGQGRPLILDRSKDEVTIIKAVKEERQRLDQAKKMIEEQTSKSFSKRTLQRFLKNLTANTKGFD